MDDIQVRDLFEDCLSPVRFQGLDVDQIIGKGRRVRRFRRAAAIAVLVAVVFAGAGLLLSVLPDSRRGLATVSPVPAVATGSAGRSTATPSAGRGSSAVVTVIEPSAMAQVSATEEYSIVATSRVTVAKGFHGTAPFSEQTVVEFPLPKGCITSAVLELGTADATFPSGAISIYPSALAQSVQIASATPRTFRYDTLLDNTPRAIPTAGQQNGRATWHANVTAVAQLWQQGGPFPSQGATVPAGSALALAITYSDINPQQTFEVHFSPPALRVTTSTKTCNG